MKNLESPDRLRLSLDHAFQFIKESRNPDGVWSDFLTLAGESVDWVTGYVGYALSRGRGPPGKEEKKDQLLAEAGSRILEHQGSNGGWGYGSVVPADADSTLWCLLFLSTLGTPSRESLKKAALFLLKHQSPFDGGFRTYALPREVGRYMMLDESVSFEGWASSQTCVTAAAAQALIMTGSLQGVKQALEFIRRTQTAEGYWNTYWWTDKLYSTTLCMEALTAQEPGKREDKTKDASPLNKAQTWIARTQLPNGGWNAYNSSTNDSWPFSTALALRGLMLAHSSNATDNTAAIKNGIEWLLTHQLTDGSWSNNHILRIPHPSMKEPWTQSQWRKDGKAINAVITDHRRLYTTATVFTALSDFEQMLSEGKEKRW